MSIFFDHASQFNRVEYACDGRPIIVFRAYPVEMAVLALESFVIAVLVKNLPQWQETLLAQELHAKGLRCGNELSREKQSALLVTAIEFMEEKELEIWRRLMDRLGKAQEVEHSAFGFWLDRLKSIRR